MEPIEDLRARIADVKTVLASGPQAPIWWRNAVSALLGQLQARLAERVGRGSETPPRRRYKGKTDAEFRALLRWKIQMLKLERQPKSEGRPMWASEGDPAASRKRRKKTR